MLPLCEHFDTGVDVDQALDVCSPCMEIGGRWHHLRQCLTCGLTACCDNSPNRHATAHWHASAHPMVRSAQPNEDWRWCFPDQLFFLPSANGYEVAED